MSGLSGALCVGRHELFDSVDRLSHVEAAQICLQCPVRSECHELLKVQQTRQTPYKGGPIGTWAGELVGTKRRDVAREHGTTKGYWQHKNRREDACDECLEGYRFSEWMRKRYGVAV